MFVCKNCGAIFAEPAVLYDDPSPAGVSLSPGTYRYDICPECGSVYVEDADRCPVCNDWHLTDTVLCGECEEVLADGLERIRKGMGLTKDDFEQAIVEHFGW